MIKRLIRLKITDRLSAFVQWSKEVHVH